MLDVNIQDVLKNVQCVCKLNHNRAIYHTKI